MSLLPSNHCFVVRSTLAIASSVVILLTGCALTSTAPTASVDSEGQTFHGSVHGGQNPVAGATVRIWAAGSSGYGSTLATPVIGGVTTPSLLASTVTDTGGNFAFGSGAGAQPYTCPASNPLIYITAQGGDPTGTGNGLTGDPNVNSAIFVMSVLSFPTATTNIPVSLCATVKAGSPFLVMNEVTTVASIYALAQFYNPVTATNTGVPAIGAPSTNALGIAAGFNVVPNLVNIPSGFANTSYQPYGNNNGVTPHNQITAFPEYQKIYLLADIIAACINTPSSTSAACQTLFTNAVPPPTPAITTLGASTTYPTAKDTLTAAYYLAMNPINASTPGVPDLTAMSALYTLPAAAAPFQPEPATQPTDWTLGITYNDNVLQSSGNSYALTAPTSLAVDNSGLIWFSNQPSGSVSSITSLNTYGGVNNNAFASRSPTQGLALSNDTTVTEYIAGVSAANPSVYKVATSSTENKITNGGAAVQATFFATDGPVASGNVFFSSPSGYLFETPASSITGTLATSPAALALTPLNNGHLATVPATAITSNIALDTNGNLWIPGGASGSLVTQIAYSGANVSTTPNVITGGLYLPNEVAVDHNNTIWVTNAAGNSPANGFLAYIPTTAGVAGAPVADTVNNHGGINNPVGVAIDGAGNVWAANAGQAGSGQSVSEFALLGGTLTPLSPGVGYTHTFNGPTSLAVDQTGNVWVANTSSLATTGNGGMITEIIGAAVPVVNSLAKGVANNTLGTKP